MYLYYGPIALVHIYIDKTVFIKFSFFQNEHTTKTVARSFAPEFSHFFDLSLPVKLDTHGHTTMVATSLAERLEHTSALLEVWHCMPKHQTTTTSSSEESHTTLLGRRLGGTLQDVLLGSVEVPLNSLLLKHTGEILMFVC